jgi:1,4-alpha-glucan branching enzyme
MFVAQFPHFPESNSYTLWGGPEAFLAGLQEAQRQNNLLDASLRALNHRQPVDNTLPELKLVEFSLAQPSASSVQLAADFTDWETAPIDMVRFADGVWATTIPLPAGVYAYRFLVDGQWHEDPGADRCGGGTTRATKNFIRIE